MLNKYKFKGYQRKGYQRKCPVTCKRKTCAKARTLLAVPSAHQSCPW